MAANVNMTDAWLGDSAEGFVENIVSTNELLLKFSGSAQLRPVLVLENNNSVNAESLCAPSDFSCRSRTHNCDSKSKTHLTDSTKRFHIKHDTEENMRGDREHNIYGNRTRTCIQTSPIIEIQPIYSNAGSKFDLNTSEITEKMISPDEYSELQNIDCKTAHSSCIRDQHCHAKKDTNRDKVARNQLLAVCILCLGFMCGEAVGGALSNSLALFTDVLHLFSDLLSFLMSLLAIYLSRKPSTKKMMYGYHRAEVLGALFSVFLIWMVTGVLCYMAAERIIHEHYKDVQPNEMLITASLGVVFNIIMGFVLHSEKCCKSASSRQKFGHSHNHSHSHGGRDNHSDISYEPLLEDEDVPEKKHKNINVRAAFIHVIGDIIQSVGVLIAALIMKLAPNKQYYLADPICTFLFSIIVLFTTITILRDTLLIIMEGVPRDVNYDRLKADLAALDNVKMVHSLHAWALTLDKHALMVHLAIDVEADHELVLKAAMSMLQKRYTFYRSSIQVEKYNSDVMSVCPECHEPKDSDLLNSVPQI